MSVLGAPWAMLVRVLLLPLLLVAVLASAFAGGGGSPPGSFVRVSLDVDASRRLWAAESAAAGHPWSVGSVNR